MGKALIRKRKRKGKYGQLLIAVLGVLFVFVCYQNMALLGDAPALGQLVGYAREEIAVSAWKNCMMAMLCEQKEAPLTLESFLMQKIEGFYPIYAFSETIAEYDTQIESDLNAGMMAENEQESHKGKKEEKEEQSKKEKGQKKEADKKEKSDKKEKAGEQTEQEKVHFLE